MGDRIVVLMVFVGLCASMAQAAIIDSGNVSPPPSWCGPETILYIGHIGAGSLKIDDDSDLTVAGGFVGFQPGATGEVTVSDSGSTWTNSFGLSVGSSGNGTLDITNGGAVSNERGFIGNSSGSTGGATVSDPGSTWTNSSYLYIGNAGNGTLEITDGGAVSNTSGYVGDDAGSTGEVTVSGTGATWTNSGVLYVGNLGDGTLRIADGGTVSNTRGTIGDRPDSTGAVTVSGAGATWANSGNLHIGCSLQFVGDGGDGTLNIADGGTVSNTKGYIGSRSGFTSAVTVSGAGSTWANSAELYVGGSDVFLHSGDGALDITTGGAVSNTSGYIGFDSASAGEVTVSGPGATWTNSISLRVGSSGNGTLAIANGGAVSDKSAYIGFESDSTGEVTVSGAGSTWTNVNLYVGHYGHGTLDVSRGGAVNNTSSRIGYFSDSTGAVTVSDTGSIWTSSTILSVGQSGDGTLVIANGGVVSNGGCTIGAESDSTGMVTVSGVAKGGIRSTLTNSSGLCVGVRGNGTLDITHGGAVSNTDGYIGKDSHSTGTATVSGTGSTWTNSGDLYVGSAHGDGTLNIADGGLVEVTGDTCVASSPWSANVVNFDGGTLTTGGLRAALGDLTGTGTINTHGWVSDGNLVFDATHGLTRVWTLIGHGRNIKLSLDVDGSGSMGAGYGGNGSMDVLDGLVVQSTYGYVGCQSGVTGAVTVRGAGSTWSSSASLYIGYEGNGSLNIADGGLVEVGGTLQIGEGRGTVGVGTTGDLMVTGDVNIPDGAVLNVSGGLVAGAINVTGGLLTNTDVGLAGTARLTVSAGVASAIRPITISETLTILDQPIISVADGVFSIMGDDLLNDPALTLTLQGGVVTVYRGGPVVAMPETDLIVVSDTTVDFGNTTSATFGDLVLGPNCVLTIAADSPLSMTFRSISGDGRLGGTLGGVTVTEFLSPGDVRRVMAIEAAPSADDVADYVAMLNALGLAAGPESVSLANLDGDVYPVNSVVPEPASLSLLLIGGLLIGARRRRSGPRS